MINLLSLAGGVETGDKFPIALVIFIAVLCVSVAALVLLFLGRKK